MDVSPKPRSAARARVIVSVVGLFAACAGLGQSVPTLERLRVNRVRAADESVRRLPQEVPEYFRHTYHAFLSAPVEVVKHARLPNQATRAYAPCWANTDFDHATLPPVLKQTVVDRDPTGCVGSYQPAGDTTTATNSFFESLGTNGRTCVTCHEPPSGMSVTPANIKKRYLASAGTDPIFQGVDGANCPNNLPPNTGGGSAFRKAHSLLLTRGDFRIFLPIPKNAEFTASVISDPYGCNNDPNYNSDTLDGETVRMLSLYRRPRMSANLNFINTVIIPGPGGAKIPAIMWDMREPSLASQALDATLGHAQAPNPPGPTAAQVMSMVNFESGIFSAQSYDDSARALAAAGSAGGPVQLASAPVGQGGPPANIGFSEFDAWPAATGGTVKLRQASIKRGEILFNTKSFIVSNVAGLNDISLGGAPPINAVAATCSSCHNQTHAGNSFAGNLISMDIGVGGGSLLHGGPPPSPHLPIFEFTCFAGKSTPYKGAVVRTNDPGQALISGKCADIGKFSTPQLRSLAARAPYFSDGSAFTLAAVVRFYNQRFAIGLTHQESRDLVNFLNAL